VEDLRHWIEADRKVGLRAFDLIRAIVRDPFAGIGKPEPLKYLAPGVWSRRLTQEHRIVYRVSEDRIDFLQARYHYQ
jgi:toxin YoeB